MSDEIDRVFRALVDERGGEGSFSVAQLAIAQHAAALLGDRSSSPHSISSLLGMLPPVKGAASEYDAERIKFLSDEELHWLDRISSILTGQELPTPQPTNSDREAWPFIRALAALELRGVSPHWQVLDRVRPEPSELIEIKGLLDGLLLNAGISGEELFQEVTRDHGCQARLMWIEPGDVLIPSAERSRFAPPALLPRGTRFLADRGDGVLRCGAEEPVDASEPVSSPAGSSEARATDHAEANAGPPDNVIPLHVDIHASPHRPAGSDQAGSGR